MRYLGIDYGTKRIGLALSDEGGKVAFPESVISSDPRAFEHIAALVREREVGGIVIGASYDLSGERNPVMRDIERFAGELVRATGTPLHFEREQFTSAQAARSPERERRPAARAAARKTPVPVDASAAALILQQFLDRNGGEGECGG